MKKLIAIAAMLGVLAGCYTQGIKISDDQFDEMIVGRSKKADVEMEIGHPDRKEVINGNELWYFDFLQITSFGNDKNGSTVFEFNKSGTLVKKYKTGTLNK